MEYRCDHCYKCGEPGHFIYRVAPAGQGAAQETQGQSQQCVNCGKWEEWANQYLRCSQCHASHYCSNVCQRMHWGEHKKLCQAIRDVESRHSRASFDQMKTSFPSHITPRQRTKLTTLVLRSVLCQSAGKRSTYPVN